MVRLGINKKTGEKVAVKVIDKKSLGEKTHMIHTEVDILKRIEHPHIVLLKEMFETPSFIYLVMELYVLPPLFLLSPLSINRPHPSSPGLSLGGLVYTIFWLSLGALHCIMIIMQRRSWGHPE